MAATLKQLDYSILQQCMHCGMCLPTCPTYDTTKRERNSPRGRISLMRSIADNELEITRQFADEMSYCLGCLACQTACPAGINYAELFETARADIETSGLHQSIERSFWRTLTLRILFMRPRLLRLFGKLLALHQRSGLEAFIRRSGLTQLLPENLRRLEPQSPTIAKKFSNQLIAEIETPPAPAKYQVALLTGCMQDLIFSDINRDTVDVLLANGCQVHTPPVQPCCGSLHAHNGERELARTLARRMLRNFPPHRYDAILSNAGGCGSHLRHYGPLLADDPEFAATAKLWDSKLRDIHEWLAEIGCRAPTAAPFEQPVTVTYHDSCHLTHGQKVTLQPRAILKLLPGIHLTELPEAHWCCGSAGVYSITQPEESARLLDRKINHILATGAQYLATANPGCHLQILNGLTAAGALIQVIHPISLLAKAYKNERSTKLHSISTT
jgi:glycolate oxidase iron-sulfur subunit